MGGLGYKGEWYMYHWIEDKEFLGAMRSLCSGIINELVQSINNDGRLCVCAHMVGSGARHLETQNGNEPIDLDYNLNILKSCDFDINREARAIKEYIQEMFNAVLDRYDLQHCQDSTSALSTHWIHFTKGNQTEFKIDLAIVREERDGSWHRLIHGKTGFVSLDRWYWNEGPDSKGLEWKVQWLKTNDCWLEVREAYLDKKNMYLRRGDRNHPSFKCYIEAINEVFYQYH